VGTDPIDSLAAEFRGTVARDPESRARAGRDGSHLVGRPLAVAAPRGVDDVVVLVRWARDHRVPLVPRGAGTSLDGESVPHEGSVVVDLSAWNSVQEVRTDEGWARVGPGVVNRTLQETLERQGTFFPPNPGSWATSTIGGNVGTNASGPRSFRYGPTRAWVRGLEVVLGTGEIVRLGTRAPKRSAGPELLSLIVGSEGTLGIVTEVTVGTAPLPAVRRGLVFSLVGRPSLARIAGALRAARETGLSAVEYLDAACAQDLAERRGVRWPTGAPLLLLEIEAEGTEAADAREERVRSVLRGVGVLTEPQRHDDANRLWTERGESGRVLDERYGERIREDVCVPLPAIDDLVGEIAEIARRAGVPVFLFGHLGEGSLHPNFVLDPVDPAAGRIRASLLAAALRLGGTISGEHGIGALKAPYLADELGPGAVRLLGAVKRACDPDGILNPGKLYPPAPS
jgi:FAD/FMN-containing dehydrogenase